MREIQPEKIIKTVKQLCIDANYHLGKDVIDSLEEAYKKEKSPVGKDIISQILEHDRIADEGVFPACQDTGSAIVFVEMGADVFVKGNLFDAINEGVRQGYKDGYLRKSICDPITRKNTGDNTPAVIHMDIVSGDKLKITVAPKGGGSENMSFVKMMKPADGIEGVKSFVIESVRQAGSNPCPPIVVGVGVGAPSFEKCAQLAKKSLLRPIGSRNPDKFYADVEQELLEKVNMLGVGPQGLGGTVTALDVHIEVMPCHIASFPSSVNICCHSDRHKEATI